MRAGQTDNKEKQEEQLWNFYFEILLNQNISIWFEDAHNYNFLINCLFVF